jgi:hypothetical protein
MSDYYPAEIRIGGQISRRLLGRLIPKIVAEGASLYGYGQAAATPQALRAAFQEGRIVHLYDDRAHNGEFRALEAFLVRHQIHFDRRSDACWEYSAEKAFYRGGAQPLVLLTDQAGNLVFRAEELAAILERDSWPDHDKVAALRQLLNPPERAPLSPIHLVKE